MKHTVIIIQVACINPCCMGWQHIPTLQKAISSCGYPSKGSLQTRSKDVVLSIAYSSDGGASLFHFYGGTSWILWYGGHEIILCFS